VNVPSKEIVFVCFFAAITPALHAADRANDYITTTTTKTNKKNNNNNNDRAQYHSSGSASYLLPFLLPYSP
jgi:hypothetical protein